jgi:hypothetical protein
MVAQGMDPAQPGTEAKRKAAPKTSGGDWVLLGGFIYGEGDQTSKKEKNGKN